MQVLLLTIVLQQTTAQKIYRTDVLVVGASASGIAAGIQSARMGAATIVAEPSTWLGGMITAAGVCAFDGNHNLPSGIFGEFRSALYKVYGGPSKVATGWVSNTLFEPHVGDSIFKTMVASTQNLTIQYQWQFQKTILENGVIKGAAFTQTLTGEKSIVYANQVIDATELGDVLASAGIPYDLGMESNEITKENVHKGPSNDIVQDITYVVILKDYGMGKDCTIVKPLNYNPDEFDAACTNYYFNLLRPKPNVDAQKMLNYGKLPNNKYMINWPGFGNDIYLNIVEMKEEDRQKQLIKAKEQTLRFIYFIQHQLGFKHLGLADDEYPTKDRFPLIPYHRESRRVKGLVRMDIHHIAKPFQIAAPLYRTGIAVGDYPIDHHHDKYPNAPEIDFPKVPSFSIPFGALIPKETKGLIVADKPISVSNIVNGSTRLQPAVLQIGQAAGIIAAIAIKRNLQPAEVNIREVQQTILDWKGYLMPYYDVPPEDPHFQEINRVGATGFIRGVGEPYLWANRTWFYPDSIYTGNELKTGASAFGLPPFSVDEGPITQGKLCEVLSQITTKDLAIVETEFRGVCVQLSLKYNKNEPISRRTAAVALDRIVNPFAVYPINKLGKIIRPKESTK